MTVKKQANREELPVKMTWDLTRIYTSDEAWEEDFKKIDEIIRPFQDFKGKLKTSSTILIECLKASDETKRFMEKLYTYANLKSDEDKGNSHYQAMLDKITSQYFNMKAALSWIHPEIIAIDDDIISEFLKDREHKFYQFVLEKLRRNKPHTLSESEERILAMLAEISNVPYKTFSMLNNADIRFPEVPDGEGGMVEMSHALYSKLRENKDRVVRKKAFDAMYDTYGGFKNTLSATIDGAVKSGVINSRIRNHASALQANLFPDNIEKSVYENLIRVVEENLSLFHRYVDLRKRILKLDDLDMYDLYVPLVKELDIKVSWEQACEWAGACIKPLGPEYESVLNRAFSERWIDILECRGKRSGAYSGGCYDTNPYILLNYNETLDSVFTLVHELGHSMHSYFSNSTQEYCYSDYSIFVAEVASTTNEFLLTEYLLKTTNDHRFTLYLLNHLCDGFKGTVFRQVQFAEFEKAIYEKAEANIPLTVDELNRTYYAINKKYYGPAITADKKIELEWACIPHFYYNFYVYKYATGFSAAACLSADILSGDQKKVAAYIEFLKSGSSKYPLEILKDTGVDLTTTAPILQGLKKFEQTLDELEELL
ncbi:MAG: oligoendopeptidase F [Spirochaetales bacterium]|nr:oligoendopeptidase F [Spirochaetales bacterium]